MLERKSLKTICIAISSIWIYVNFGHLGSNISLNLSVVMKSINQSNKQTNKQTNNHGGDMYNTIFVPSFSHLFGNKICSKSNK
jgi:hypothetical protein